MMLEPSSSQAGPPLPAPSHWKSAGLVTWEIVLVSMAVVLPVITLLAEALSGWCAGLFFDPIPSPLCLALVALVPAANLLVWLGARRGWGARGRLLGLVNGAALASSFLYALLFLPLTPFALLGIFSMWWYMGLGLIGLLPLSPLLAFVAALVLRRRLLRAFFPGERALPGLRVGMVLALLLFAAAGANEAITLTGLRWAASESPERQARGIDLLRRMDRNDAILRASHGGDSLYGNVLLRWMNGGKDLDSARARSIYYQVTGRDALQEKRGDRSGNLFRRRALSEEFEWDDQQGGSVVGGILKGLTLQSSRLDGKLDGAAGTGYVEWILVFRNDDAFSQREARATVALPPGAVVSRLTLWVNGEEREAAFGSKGAVTEAYQKVVRARRDPVLVTSRGPGRILVQCFPVEPKGGEMKMRLGLTVPLQPAAETSGVWRLQLPVFLERNFKWAGNKGHELWLESPSILKADPGLALACETNRDGAWQVRGTLPEAAVWKSGEALTVAGTGDGTAWCRDATGDKPGVVLQHLVDGAGDKPASVILVVDGSVSMKNAAPRIASALTNAFPAGVRLGVVMADDAKSLRPVLKGMTPEKLGALAASLEGFEYIGGRCNVGALETAWDTLSGEPGPACIVWVHGPQVLTRDSPDALLQRQERQPGMASIICLQVAPGADKVAEALDMMPMVRTLPPCEDPETVLAGLFRSWGQDVRQVKVLRNREERAPGAGDGAEASGHLARLWAAQEVSRLLGTGRPVDRTEAGSLAARYHLVTPVSGAVVLETAQQFREAGLQPVPEESLPTVPEPELWILAGVVLVVVAWQWRRRLNVAA